MCGLIGYSGKTPVDKYKFKILLLYARDRGTDGYGIGYRRVDEKDNVEKFFQVKELGDPRKNVADLSVPIVNTIIGHTRNASSHTSKTTKALHPHFSGNYFGTHNGYLWNYNEIARQMKYDGTSDSITFFEALSKNKGDFGKTVEVFSGSGAFAYLDNLNNLHLAVVSGRPLHYGYLNGNLWYASLKEYLNGIGIKETTEIKEGQHLTFKEGNLVETTEGHTFKKTYSRYSGYGNYGGYGYSQTIGYDRQYSNQKTNEKTYNIDDFTKGKHAPFEADIVVDKNGKISYYWLEDSVITVETLGIYSTSTLTHYDLTREIDIKELSRQHNEIYQITLNTLLK